MSTLKQFEGRTVEEALERASAELGSEVSLTDATRDRRGGLFGFFTKERFTVTAVDPDGENQVPADDPDRTDFDSFSRVLDAMVDDVDDVAERSTGPTNASEVTGSSESESGPLVDLVGLTAKLDERRTAIDLSEGRRVPSISPSDEIKVVGGSTQPREQAALFAAITSDRERLLGGDEQVQQDIEVVKPSAPAIVSARKSRASRDDARLERRAEEAQADVEPPVSDDFQPEAPAIKETDRGQAWSIERLASLGIPGVILDRLEVDETRSDLEWAAALERVIGEVLDDLKPSSTIHVFGTGLESASELLVAAVAGLAPDHLLIDDHRIPATATELALAVRECLR